MKIDSDSVSIASNDDPMTSSIKSENFKEIWKIIDEHENNDSSILNNNNNNQPINSIIKVTGLKPNQQLKSSILAVAKSPGAQKKTGFLTSRTESTKLKIRNYNDKS
jgi:hypothetical protein